MLNLIFIYLAYILAITSVLSLWTRFKAFGYITVTSSLIFASLGAIVSLTGLLVITIIIIFIHLSFYFKSKKGFSLFFFGITAVILFLNYIHFFPGFNNICIIKNVQISKDAIPFSLYLNYSSIIPTYFLLLFSSEIRLLKNLSKLFSVIKSGVFYGLIAVCILIPISYLFDFIKFDFKLTHYTLVFIFVNLIFTCLSEEIFWRGFIQSRLQKYFNPIIAVIFTSIAFAFIHIAFAGTRFALLAFIASLIYGIAYSKTKKIEVNIICHYLVNIGQFIFFTYPILAKAYLL
ncbi:MULTISPECIES: CPBP family intramembrane glutamic endopeptidase [Francisella]|uniref:CPBP family intramembrane metalloprotease n=1 Tax=Francisella opportunistica TaxID=2016517 RepID=A0A345JPG6_9GAMM|nr:MULTISPECIES: type II CAAX endopeptidase family protein [Francisella]APC90884.1 CAAX amino terminal protease family protein [Francisella sp. MA067296]AXH29212.1 CPBP family intramembrane metalloprotease [Francisella opportunistica]AXH30863.1 CPBP family intramembrane metalloprotease [Francisella opportunistica]AXH32508.1 CPBP family intramembrane metalloprotease [Francisella opportunistica]